MLARRHGPLALVQLDSHCDTWEQYFGQKYFHGTTFKRAVEEGLLDAAASVQAGMRGPVYDASDLEGARGLGFTVIESEELRRLGPERYAVLVSEKVGERPVFLSFDIDFLDPAFAPGTGTPGGRRLLDSRGDGVPAFAPRDQPRRLRCGGGLACLRRTGPAHRARRCECGVRAACAARVGYAARCFN